MRGRSLVKEPAGSSICAFCAHRLGAARRPSHLQRRFLQSSHPSLKPPTAGEALRDDSDDFAQSRRATPPWGGRASWGQASAGQLASPSARVGWGGPISDGQQPSNGQVNHLNSAPGEHNLLPHEIRARELLLESRKRQVPIRNGFGPENTRSGRPDPASRVLRSTEAERLNIARAAFISKNEKERSDARQRDSGNTLVRRTLARKYALGDIAPAPTASAPNKELDKPPHWTQLKKRGSHPYISETPRNVEPKPTTEDPFAVARAKRVEEAKLQNYTPLGGRSVPPPLSKDKPPRDGLHWGGGFRQEPQTNPRGHDDLQFIQDRRGGSAQNNTADRAQSRWVRPSEDKDQNIGSRSVNVRAAYPSENGAQRESFSRFGATRDEARDGEPVYQRSGEIEKPKDSREIQNQEERQFMDDRSVRKSPSRFLAPKSGSEFMSRGRGRDKARRREQFLGDEDENGIDEARLRAGLRAELRQRRKKEKEAKKAAAPVPILLPEYISVSNLAMALRVRVEDFVEKLEELGFEEKSTDFILNAEDSGLIAMEYNYEAIIDRSESEDLKPREPAKDPSILPARPPVVTIMGHVDHGKTTLLDWLRKSSVAASEHGGITQHIGAFSVPMPSGKIITFLDTPGHSAFESMRKRGANVTDIVILVVAADDSVKPQTIEAIKHAKAARVPIIVAINKIDKEEKNIERVKQDLARHGVDVEDFGGDTQVVCVSGKTGQGMEDLEEAASTLSEILDMRAEVDGEAEGWVLEASVKSMGKVATILVRRGTMRPGDFIVAGKTWARIRCLRNEAGVEIESAGPGMPVEIDGWREQPEAGDEVLQAPSESKAKSVVDYRLENEERNKMAEDMEAINDFRQSEQLKRTREREDARLAAAAKATSQEYIPESVEAKPTGPKEIPFIVKGDVSGSVEAVVNNISVLGNKEVKPLILRSGVGQVSEFDIEHAAAAQGHVISFNTPVEPHISQLAERNKVTIIDQNVIYRLVDDVRAELSTHLPPLITQKVLGEAEIAQIFEITFKGRQQRNIAGCKIRNGTIAKNAKVRVLRNSEKVFDGALASLKNVKKDVQEMKKGSECGIGFDNWFEFNVGDLIQSYEELREKRYL